MGRSSKLGRYIVTGPGITEEPSYADPGPALSRSITAASQAEGEGTFYVRDAITHRIIGYSERGEHGVIITRRGA